MALTQDRQHSLLPDPVPASSLGQLPTLPVRQQTRLPQQWRPSLFPRRLLILSVLFLILLLGGGVGIIVWALLPQITTITITPQQSLQEQSVTIMAVTGNPTEGQIRARALSATATRQTPTPVATAGIKNIPELVAHGQITFYNGLNAEQTVNAYTVLTASNGVQVKTLAQAVLPPSPGSQMTYTSVPAQATQPGSIGNISVHAVSVNIGTGGSILARNENAFTGGQDAENYRFVQQQDIDHAAAGLTPQALQSAKTALAAQVHRGDLAVGQQCTTTIQSVPAAGDKAATVSVTVTAVCHEDTYTPQTAQFQATAHYRAIVERKLGSSYALAGKASLSSAQVIAQDRGLAITYSIRGRWLYQIDLPALTSLVSQFLGKPWAAAQAGLLKQPGVATATIRGDSGNTLPTNQGQVKIQIGD